MSVNRVTRPSTLPKIEQQDERKCPICKDLLREPRRLLCTHVYCTPCLLNLQTSSRDGTFRCPLAKCRMPCSTEVTRLPACDKLRRKANRAREAAERRPREALQLQRQLCQENGCGDLQAEGSRAQCPHCRQSLCSSHLQEHIRLIRADYQQSKELLQLQKREVKRRIADAVKLKQHIGACIENIQNSFRSLLEALKKQMERLNLHLSKLSKEIETAENEHLDLLPKLEQVLAEQRGAEFISAADMWRDLTEARELIAKSESLRKIPSDVSIQPDLQQLADSFINSLGTVKVQVRDQDLQVCIAQHERLQVKDSSQTDFHPEQAYVWENTAGFCIDWQELPQVARCSATPRPSQRELTKPVILATSMKQIRVLSPNSTMLGFLVINQDPKIRVKRFCCSPRQDQIAVALTLEGRIFVCDMSGRVMKNLPCPGNLSSLSLTMDQLIVADAGVMERRFRQPGSVIIYHKSHNFDRSRRIPLEELQDESLFIFPIAVVAVQTSYFLLTSNRSGENSEPSVQQYNEDLQQIHEFATPDMVCPSHMCTDSAGLIYVSDHPGCLVFVFSSLGKPIGCLRDFGAKSCHGLSVSEPSDSQQKWLLVSDTQGGVVHLLPLCFSGDC